MRAIVTAAIMAGLAGAANAASYRFDVSDPDATLGGQPLGTYHFFLDSSPTPAAFDATTFMVEGTTYSHTFSDNATFDSFTFYDASGGGGFDDFENVYEGDVLFTGTTAQPTFRLGTFALDNFVNPATITISAVGTGTVPEPAAWALLVGGFGLVGGALRRSRSPVAA